MLGIVEFAVLFASVYAGVWLRRLGIFNPFQLEPAALMLFARALVFATAVSMSMVSMGLYQSRLREGFLGVLLRLSVSFMMAAVALALVFYVVPALLVGRGALTLAVIVAYVALAAGRYRFLKTVDQSVLRRRVLVLGAGERAANFSKLRRRSDQRGFRIVGFVHVQGERDVLDEAQVIQLDQPLLELVRELEVDEIVVAVNDRRRNFPTHELLDCRLSGIEIVDSLTFFERETGRVMLELLHPSWLIFSEGFNRGPVRGHVERGFDVVASFLLLLVTLPLLALSALAIVADGGWRMPVLYRQVRIGENGRPFQLLKFRSMRVDAELDGIAKWAQRNDSRVTRVGRVIRKMRIDELPQIYNILRGDMSFVGPRPERPEFVTRLAETIPYYEERHRVKPGLTGWAQLNYPYGASEQDAAEKLQFDLYYIKNHSLLLDILVLMQTAEVVLFGKGTPGAKR
ncbi:MAG: TIGR03013 family PEP-CTERM/XrtA system glycosyltransferase [Pseudomonadota bacterium]|nr:MAG: TIGR03013 family PEP-CTERM/XrtA system glycosyltransferase [Pseudomonadota bacterium]